MTVDPSILPALLSALGSTIAISGGIVSVLGNLLNTVYKSHRLAIRLWTFSSFMIMIWGFGYLLHLWVDGLAVAAITGMNVIFFISNVWGWLKDAGHP
jgi:hypothetical protein